MTDQTSSLNREREYSLVRLWGWIPAIVGVFAMLIWGQLNGWPEPERTIDIDQPRLNTAVPAPQPDLPLSQSFVARHDGLSEIEVLVVHYDADNIANTALALLVLKDPNGRVLSYRQLVNNQTQHNQTVKLTFPPQTESSGLRYTLTMSTADAQNKLGLWGYSLNVLGDGTLVTSEPSAAQTLHFKTRYTVTGATGWRSLAVQWTQYGGIIFLILVWLPLPGVLLLVWWPSPHEEAEQKKPRPWPVQIGLAFGLGTAAWPFIWYWWSVIGRFSGVGLWVLFLLGWGAVGYRLWTTRPVSSFIWSWGKIVELCAFLFAFVGILSLRLLTVRDLAFLPWVDASRHGLITAVFADAGYWMNSYEPYLPVNDGYYHYGFHTLSASLHLMLGTAVSLETLLLVLMQVISALVCMTVFSGTWLVSQRKTAAWVAMLLVALPFLFPSYYTTWGRLTQITAVFLLPLAFALTWDVLHRRAMAKRELVWLALVVASIALIHMRVFMIYLPAVLVIGLFARRYLWRTAVPLILSGVGALLLISPRLWLVVQEFLERRERASRLNPNPGPNTSFNRFPAGYVDTGWEPAFWWIGLVFFLVIPLLWWFYRSRFADKNIKKSALAIYALALWAGLVLLLTAGHNIHPDWPQLLPEVSVNSAYISLFVPLSMVLGISAVRVHELLSRQHWLAHLFLYAVHGGLLAATLLFGIPHQLHVLNDSTILARPADIDALAWVRDHTPRDAYIAHSSWRWLGNTWAGTDGGAWLVPLTGRLSSTPPIDHVYNRELLAEVRQFNLLANDIADWGTAEAGQFLIENGVDYVFVGERGGFFDPAELQRNPIMELVYHQDAVFIFAVVPEP